MTDQASIVHVFFYGLFMDEALLRQKGLDPKQRRLGQIDNYSLVIGARATLVRQIGASAHGVVFTLTQAEMEHLYSEPSVKMYIPEVVLVRLDNGAGTYAMCFNLPCRPATEERNHEYATKLKELATRIGLPADYVDSI